MSTASERKQHYVHKELCKKRRNQLRKLKNDIAETEAKLNSSQATEVEKIQLYLQVRAMKNHYTAIQANKNNSTKFEFIPSGKVNRRTRRNQ